MKASRGQVLPLVGLLVVVLLGFAALAADVGYDRYEKRIQQSAADSAAIAGAAEIPFGHVKESARYDASQNGFTDNSAGGVCTVCVTVTNPYNGDGNAVEVVVSAAHPTFFQRIFGTQSVTVTARAVARSIDDNGCLYLLATKLTNFNNATINAHDCAIISNGDALMSGTVDAAAIEVYDFKSNHFSGTFPDAQPAKLPVPVSDPCQRIAGCQYLSTWTPPASCPDHTANAGDVVYPGCYGRLTINGNVTFTGGVDQPYVITNRLDLGNSTVTGSNVTVILGNGAHLNANGAALNFSAPTSGNMKNVALYDPYNNTSWDKVDLNVNGLIYVPGGHANFNHSFGSYTVSVFSYVNFNQSVATFTLPGAANGGSLIKDAVLSE